MTELETPNFSVVYAQQFNPFQKYGLLITFITDGKINLNGSICISSENPYHTKLLSDFLFIIGRLYVLLFLLK